MGTHNFLEIFVLLVSYVAAGSEDPIDTLKCINYGNRTVNCTYDVPNSADRNYRCCISPPGKKSCQNFSSKIWNWTMAPGECSYKCNPCSTIEEDCGYCRNKQYITVDIIYYPNITGSSSKMLNLKLNSLFKPGTVRDLKVDNITSSRLTLTWTKPDDYDNDNERYSYTITLNTGHTVVNYTKKSKADDVRKRLRIKEFVPWKQYNITVRAMSVKGGYSSELVFISGQNDTVVKTVIKKDENNQPFIIMGVMGVMVMVVVPLIVISFRMRRKCCERFQIVLPKESSSSTDHNIDVQTPLVMTDTRPTMQDSGRGSMETNNNDLHEVKDQELDDATEKAATEPVGPPDIHVSREGSSGEQTDSPDLSGSGEDNSWNDSGGSGISGYRQRAPGNVDEDNTSSVSESESVASYSEIMQTPISSNSQRAQLEATDITVMNDTDSTWDCSAESTLSSYRQFAGEDNGGDVSVRGVPLGDQGQANNCSVSKQLFSPTCSVPVTVSADSYSAVSLQPLKEKTNSSQEVTLEKDMTDCSGSAVYEVDNSWEDFDGSASSAYRLVPTTDDNTEGAHDEDCSGVSESNSENRDDSSVSNLLTHIQYVSSSSLSQSTSGPESVASYSAMSVPDTPCYNTDSHC